MRFVIEQVLGAPASWSSCVAFADLDAEAGRCAGYAALADFADPLLAGVSCGERAGCAAAR